MDELFDCTGSTPEQVLATKVYTRERGWGAAFGYLYCYAAGVWHRLPNSAAVAHILDHLERCYVLQGKDRVPNLKFGNKRFTDATLGTLLYRNHIPALEVPGHLFVFENGTLDSRAGVLLPHKPEHYATVSFACSWTPDASPPEAALRFIDTCYGPDRRQTIRAILRYTLDLTMPFGIFVYLVGEPGSGKGLLIRLAAAMLPSYRVSSINGDMSPLGSREGLQQNVAGRQLLAVRDLVEAKGVSASSLSTLYSLVDNEPLSIRGLYSSDAPSMELFCRVWVGSTQLPQLGCARTADDGWKRRVLYINTLPPSGRPDPSLRDDLLGDPAAVAQVVAWALAMDPAEAWCILNRNEVDERTSELYRVADAQADSVGLFLDTCCRPHPGSVDLEEVGRVYRWWALSGAGAGQNPVSIPKFVRSVRQRLPHLHQRRGGASGCRPAADYHVGVVSTVATAWALAKPYADERPRVVSPFLVAAVDGEPSEGWLEQLSKVPPVSQK